MRVNKRRGSLRQISTELPQADHTRLQQYAAAKKISVAKLLADLVAPLIQQMPIAEDASAA